MMEKSILYRLDIEKHRLWAVFFYGSIIFLASPGLGLAFCSAKPENDAGRLYSG